MIETKTPQDANEATIGAVASTVGLERMFRVAKTDHPDLVGGIVWADCELAWINERITLAILAEREACADACEAIAANYFDHAKPPYAKCAKVIRERSNVI